MKKIIAVLLSATMLFAVCSFSAFATVVNVSTDDYSKGSIDYTDGKIEGLGTLYFNSNTRTLIYTVSCTNINHESLCDFHLWAQCAINYSDGSQDFDTRTIQTLIDPGDGAFIEQAPLLPSNKTVVSLDAEYLVWYEQDTLWEGQIYYPLIPGINA